MSSEDWNIHFQATSIGQVHAGFPSPYQGSNSLPRYAEKRVSLGNKKYGLAASLEQALTAEIGVFARYGWSDGKTDSWAFTEIDRSASGGVSIGGRSWRRADDRIGMAAARNCLSGDQRSFLAAGGLGFLIGDGRLNYRPEAIVEAYYAWRTTRTFTVKLDYQHVENPAYNQDRGPVNVESLRLHWER